MAFFLLSMAIFRFKQFDIDDHGCGMKVGTDGVLLGAWADCTHAARIADLGAGSGLLALMMAQRAPLARITAVEIDPDAARAAGANFAASPWAERLVAACADASEADLPPMDLIVCNPPYFSSTLRSPDAKRARARHAAALSPVSALRIAARTLTPDGSIAMVTPADLESELTYQAELLRLKPRRICRVSTVAGKQPARLLSQWQRADGPTEATRLDIRMPDNTYTEAYRSLTHDFYLNF